LKNLSESVHVVKEL